MDHILNDIIVWSNKNSGFVTIILFIISIIIGWISGFFKSIRKKPKFKITVIEGATFGSVIDLNKKHNGLPVNKTAFAVYLEITNIGNAPSSIGEISLGYILTDLTPKWRAKRNWIIETISKSDFTIEFKDSDLVKGFPFLKQQNMLFPNKIDTYLEVGQTKNGIVYFEQPEAFGSWMPRLNKDMETTDLIIKVRDSYGGIHKKCLIIKLIDPNISFRMNPYFGQTFDEYFISKGKDSNNIKNSDK